MRCLGGAHCIAVYRFMRLPSVCKHGMCSNMKVLTGERESVCAVYVCIVCMCVRYVTDGKSFIESCTANL